MMIERCQLAGEATLKSRGKENPALEVLAHSSQTGRLVGGPLLRLCPSNDWRQSEYNRHGVKYSSHAPFLSTKLFGTIGGVRLVNSVALRRPEWACS
jgi:hypothetical protein